MNKSKKISSVDVSENRIVLYTDKKGNVELRADVRGETLWATQSQIGRLFEVDVRTVNEHLKNIFKTDELSESSTIRKFRIVHNEGGREVVRLTHFYNLDAIIAVGYRVNSKQATQFRIWSTRTLREFIVRGFNLDRRKLAVSSDNLEDLKEAIAFMESESRGGSLKARMTVRMSKNLLP